MPESTEHQAGSGLERTGAVWCSIARWAIIADFTRTQIRATAAAVAPTGHIEQAIGIAVGRRSVGEAPGIVRQGIDAGDDRRGHTGTTEDQPAGFMIAIIDGDPGVGIGIGSHIGDCPPATSRVRLPGGLGDIGAAAAARSAPDRLAPPTCVVCPAERRPADSGHIPGGCWELHTVAAITRTGRDGDARVIIERLVTDLTAILAPAVAIADRVGMQCHGFINGRGQIREAIGGRLHQQDVAVWADGAHHVQVEGDFLRPVLVPQRIGGASVLSDLAEAAVRRCTGWQAKLRTIHAQVGLGIRVVVGIDERHDLATACCGSESSEIVGRLQVGGVITRGTPPTRALIHADRMTACGADEDTRTDVGKGHRRATRGGSKGFSGGANTDKQNHDQEAEDRPDSFQLVLRLLGEASPLQKDRTERKSRQESQELLVYITERIGAC
jgi:hypothetical protein